MGKWTGTPPGNYPPVIGPACSPIKNNCDSIGSPVMAYKEFWYTAVVTMPMRCNAWKIYTYAPARNSVVNMQNSTSSPMYIEATMNNALSHINSSPYYSVRPPFFSVAQNQPTNYNSGATDADGDSLWTELIMPRTGVTTCTDTPVNMAFSTATPAFNLTTNPFQTSNTFNLNKSNGQMSFTSPFTGKNSLVLRTKEYRNGVQIGSVTREILMQALYVYIPPPKLDTVSHNDHSHMSDGKVYGCIGKQMLLNFDVKSPDTNRRLFLSDNTVTSIPGMTITYSNQGTDSVHVFVSWTPNSNDVGPHSTMVFIIDSTCNPSGVTLQYARVMEFYIWGTTKTRADTNICSGQYVFLSATGGANYQWTALPGGSSNSLSNPNIANPVATPPITTTYVVTSTVNPYCPTLNKDTVTIFVRPTTPGANAISTSFGCGQNPAVNYINSCPGQPISFCFNTVSSDTNARLYPSDNHNSSLPLASITYSAAGADSIYGTFSWTPGANDVGFFSVDLKTYDSACVPTSNSHLKTQTVGIYIWPKVETTGDTFICPGEKVQLKATGGINYRWTVIQGAIPGNLSNPYISNPIASPDTTITYVATATDNIYCPNGKDTITVHVYPAQLIPKQQVNISVFPDSNIALGSTTTFTANNITCNNPAYAWYVDGDIVPDVRGNIFITSKILNRQQIWCRLFCNDTCANPGDTISNKITMRVSTGVKDITSNTGIHLYPNPNNGVFTLVSDNIETGGTIEITNIYGQVVYTAALATNKKQINLNSVHAGVYILRATTGDKFHIQRFTIR